MRPPAFRKQGGGTEAEFRAQSNIESSIASVGNSIILDGTLLENVSLSTAGTSVDHKLGRAYRGYIVCKNDTFCDIKITSNNDSKLFIQLQSSANCTVSLWVF